MGTRYTIRSGDCLSLIGARVRIPWKTIWNHTENSSLRDRRQNPNVLFPGDELYIPDLERKDLGAATEQRHTFRITKAFDLRIAVLDLRNEPLPDVWYHFSVDGEPTPSDKTKEDGIASVRVLSHDSEVTLHLPWGDFPLRVGELDPAQTLRGVQQRMTNLGIDPGPIDGIMGPKTKQALREFQGLESEAGLEPTGMPDEATVQHLRKVHDKQNLFGTINQLEHHDAESSSEEGEGEDVAESLADELEAQEQVDEVGLEDHSSLWDEVFDVDEDQ